MKIDIGPYRCDLIPVRGWERQYEFWRKPDTCYLPEKEYTWYDKIVFGFFDKLDDLVQPINRWSNRRPRKIKVHIDNYDVWSLDHTLAMIIAPALKKLKEIKHGSPGVDDDDVPEELKSTSAPPKENEWDTDENWFARWEYVLNEMIWAFEQHADPYDGEDPYIHNVEQLDIKFVPLEDGKPGSTLDFDYQKDPTKPPYWRDEEGIKQHYARRRNGLRLFAKYYDGLWD